MYQVQLGPIEEVTSPQGDGGGLGGELYKGGDIWAGSWSTSFSDRKRVDTDYTFQRYIHHDISPVPRAPLTMGLACLTWGSRGFCVPCSWIWVAACDCFHPERAEKRCMWLLRPGHPNAIRLLLGSFSLGTHASGALSWLVRSLATLKLPCCRHHVEKPHTLEGDAQEPTFG